MGKVDMKENIKTLSIATPEPMEYYVNIENAKDKRRFIERIKRIIRSSMEYRDYIQYLKENVDMDRCAFFQNVSTEKSKRGRISIEIHHEPFTLEDYVMVVLNKYVDEGAKLNDLLIADEVLELHYANMVGLVPLSKTMHEVVHNSTKVIIPLHMCYGEYGKFLEDYSEYIPEELYDKLERKINMTNSLTEESFEAIRKEFTYIDVNGFDDIEKLETKSTSGVA